MQSTIYTPSNQLPLRWKSSQITSLKSPPKIVTSTNTLRTRISYDLEDGVDGTAAGPSPLPVVVIRSGRVSRYFWDGSFVKLVDVDNEGPSFPFGNGVPKLYKAMLRAIGIGNSRSLPSAASLNWVFKDGLGRLSREFSLIIGVELLTPIYPQNFLLLASVANAVKQTSLACYLATSSAIQRSFAITDNLVEVSAKAQIQSVCFDNLGLVLAAFLNILFKNNQRLEIILDTWLQKGHVPSPQELGILLCMHEGALPQHVSMGIRQACYMREVLLTNNQWEGIANVSDYSDSALGKWFQLIKHSRQFAESEFKWLNEQMVSQGWVTTSILFNTNEQARYAYVHD